VSILPDQIEKLKNEDIFGGFSIAKSSFQKGKFAKYTER